MAVAGKKNLLERAARLLDLPGDVVAGLPRVELICTGELRMEQHQGILAYGPEEIQDQVRAVQEAGIQNLLYYNPQGDYSALG